MISGTRQILPESPENSRAIFAIGRRIFWALGQNLPCPLSERAKALRLLERMGVWPKSSILSSGKLDVARLRTH